MKFEERVRRYTGRLLVKEVLTERDTGKEKTKKRRRKRKIL